MAALQKKFTIISLGFAILALQPQAQARPMAPGGLHSEAELAATSLTTAALRVPSSVAASAEEPAKNNRPAVAPSLQTPSGVAVYDFKSGAAIPRLALPKEPSVSVSDYALDHTKMALFEKNVVHVLQSPEILNSHEFAQLMKAKAAPPGLVANLKTYVLPIKGPVSRERFEATALAQNPEKPFSLKKYVQFSEDEIRLLSGLLLYQQGDHCSSAIGMFYTLSKNKKFESEANYYLAMCSKQLGLHTDFYDRAQRVISSEDVYYTKKIFSELGTEIPAEFIEPVGKALFKAALNKKIMQFDDPKAEGNIYYDLANFGAQTERFKTALSYAPKVPKDHPKYLEAQFIQALAEYQWGSKSKALSIQETLIEELSLDKEKSEFQALVALNLGRMYFQEKNFKKSHENFLKVAKDHPLWLQSLTELGWAQLQSGDFEGAIGNMYSIQSPFFNNVYKPDSYVIRTIGYLNLCQYGDAYRTLSVLEKQYRPWMEKIFNYSKSGNQGKGTYTTVKSFIANKAATEVDGLPVQVVREMVRHRDFLNLQNAMNRQLDERDLYVHLDQQIENDLKQAQKMVSYSRSRIQTLKNQLLSIQKNPQLEQNRNQWHADLENEFTVLNGHFFKIDLFKEAKKSIGVYKTEVFGNAENRIAHTKLDLEKTLNDRLLHMKEELVRVLDNNELLRYEVFSGSGENLRYQVAGGQKGNRVPASVIPKSKSLQWDFDGEYWEDEIGHYRSTLKNNCAEGAGSRQQAGLDGDKK
jgi:tetratricopeptide (TPR) repeat protein